MSFSSLTGGGALPTSASSGASRSGPASGVSGTGSKTFNIGGNPNITSGMLNPAFIVAGVLVAVWLFRKSK